MVPQLFQNIIDAVVKGFTANEVLKLPAQFLPVAAQKLGLTPAQLQENQSGAGAAIGIAMLSILVFAAIRALFAFSQAYNAERVSQSIAYDFRNDLFAKISRLSFSYHDKNQTGQLMIRATDDVEKVRMFIGQGLLAVLQAFLLLTGSLVILWFTNSSLTLTIIPILPIALVVFMIFGRIRFRYFIRQYL